MLKRAYILVWVLLTWSSLSLAAHAQSSPVPPQPDQGGSASSGTDIHRNADPDEIYGAWEFHDGARQWPWQYVVILDDGRIGWVYAGAQLNDIKKSDLVRMIDAKAAPAGDVEGWNHAAVSVGDVAEIARHDSTPYERDYLFWIVQSVRSPFSAFGKAKSGDVVMAQYYKQMHSQHPPPLIIHRLRRLTD